MMYWFLSLLLCLELRHGFLANKVVLLDSSLSTFSNWTSVQHDGDPFITGTNQALYMWSKKTHLDKGIFFVCTFQRTAPQDNWIRSPFFNIEDAAVVSLDLEYDVERCADMAANPNCKEKFFVYYQFVDGADNSGPINSTYFSLSVHLPQDPSLADGSRQEFKRDINVTVSSEKGMFIAFRDTGSCGNVYKATMQYSYCPKITENLAYFPRTVARASKVPVDGKCLENAISRSSLPQKLCLTNGEWSTITGSCVCDAGYEVTVAGKCNACSNGTYKHSSGNNICHPCPLNSRTNQEGSTNCTCVGKYFRLTSDPAENCTAPPSAVRSLGIEEVSQTSARFSWEVPEDFGGRTDLSYKIRIRLLQNGSLIKWNTITSASFTYVGLKPSTLYRISVTSSNGAGDGPKVAFNFTTLTEPVQPSSTPVTTLVDSTIAASTVRPTSKGNAPLSTPAVVAIALSVGLVVAVGVGIIIFWWCKKHANVNANEENDKCIDHKSHNATTPL